MRIPVLPAVPPQANFPGHDPAYALFSQKAAEQYSVSAHVALAQTHIPFFCCYASALLLLVFTLSQ
jgi:hypothetical protein